jgi:DNA polymerase-3 subunit gamma/tau
MSYTVLARKWRPQNFEQLIGQEHVQRAIVNAIDQDRLHHAYLFTGTRGVGKTTIARIFSKCLNCQTGITSQPCGECDICQEIEQGHFVDLMEIDAASRTKVEDTREILDNVQYRPTRGRYKVYLIDEVHMLSNSSFNALLKTLEEPPPHVIFLLATTDPQKLPVTVLSRCLQFHLKRMTPESIVAHLTSILQQESINFDTASLNLLAQAADGSMRDSLSLLDQAIAFGGGQLQSSDVADMLGAVDQQFVTEYLQALCDNNTQAIFEITERMAEFAPDYQTVMADIISTLHKLAVIQLVGQQPQTTEESTEQTLQTLAQQFSPDDIQLFYQLGIHARKDLPLAPDARQGFEMALLRMLTFRPASGSAPSNPQQSRSGSQAKAPSSTSSHAGQQSALTEKKTANSLNDHQNDLTSDNKKPQKAQEQINPDASQQKPAQSASSKIKQIQQQVAASAQSRPAQDSETQDSQAPDSQAQHSQSKNTAVQPQKLQQVSGSQASASGFSQKNVSEKIIDTKAVAENTDTGGQESSEQEEVAPKVVVERLEQLIEADTWHDFIQQLSITGSIFQIINNSVVTQASQNQLQLNTLQSVEHFLTASAKGKIEQAMGDVLKQKVTLNIEFVETLENTPKLISEKRRVEQLKSIRGEFIDNPKVASLLQTFETDIAIENIQIH